MKKLLAVFISIFLLAACSKPQKNYPTTVIPALQTPALSSDPKVNAIRLQAIRDTALSVGAQGGLSWRAKQVDRQLWRDQDNLNRVFNFNALILKQNVLPPVLVEGDNALNLASPTALRLADRVYRIIQAPRFVTAAPTWRDYLWLNYRAPESPNYSLLPKTDEEREVWNKYVKIGWRAGLESRSGSTVKVTKRKL